VSRSSNDPWLSSLERSGVLGIADIHEPVE
jgi:hypothetical protein